MRAAVIGMMLLYEPAVRCDYLRFRAWPSEFKTIECCLEFISGLVILLRLPLLFPVWILSGQKSIKELQGLIVGPVPLAVEVGPRVLRQTISRPRRNL